MTSDSYYPGSHITKQIAKAGPKQREAKFLLGIELQNFSSYSLANTYKKVGWSTLLAMSASKLISWHYKQPFISSTTYHYQLPCYKSWNKQKARNVENQVIGLLTHFAAAFSLSPNIITGISNREGSSKSDQWNYTIKWSVVICDGIAQEAEIKKCMLEQSVYLGWVTVWDTERHFCCHTSRWNLLPTGYRKERAKEIWSLQEWLHLLKAFV